MNTLDRTRFHRRSFAPLPANLPEMRRFVADCLVVDGADRSVVHDLQLVVSELGANAVQHGDGNPVVVVIDNTDRAWWTICVSNSVPDDLRGGGLLSSRSPWPKPPPHAMSGRGLQIVRDLSDDVQIDEQGSAVTVTCRVRRRW